MFVDRIVDMLNDDPLHECIDYDNSNESDVIEVKDLPPR